MGKSGTWKVDHTLDDIFGDSDQGSYDGPTKLDSDKKAVLEDVSNELETPKEKKARRMSHWVAYTTMFVMSIGFSIVLSGVWPYLNKINPPNLDKSALGWVVAANPFGQMLASPLLGWWGNKAGSIRGACITTVICFIVGNVMYATLDIFNDPTTAYYMMIFSRFIVGVSSANVTLCRSYLAGSTTLKERTTGIAIIAAAQAMGFVVGPGIQAVLTVTVPDAIPIGNTNMVWDKYTSAGWVAAMLGFINLIVVMPCIFQEYNIAEKERALMNQGFDQPMKLPKPDYGGICTVLLAFFFGLFIYVLLETLAEPFVTDQYAVSDDFAMVAVGVALMVGGLLSIGMYVVTSYLAKRYDERILLIAMGMVPTVVGTFLFLPWGNTDIIMSECVAWATTWKPTTTISSAIQVYLGAKSNPEEDYGFNENIEPYDPFYSSLIRSDGGNEGENCTLGCPAVQEWCNTVPRLAYAQLAIAYIITIGGFPVIQALAQSIFSKMLGPKPQGVWMGILTGVGSLSRIAGPIFVSYVYTFLGPYYTFGILVIGMFIALIVLIVMYPRLIPMKIPTAEERRGHENDVAEDQV